MAAAWEGRSKATCKGSREAAREGSTEASRSKAQGKGEVSHEGIAKENGSAKGPGEHEGSHQGIPEDGSAKAQGEGEGKAAGEEQSTRQDKVKAERESKANESGFEGRTCEGTQHTSESSDAAGEGSGEAA